MPTLSASQGKAAKTCASEYRLNDGAGRNLVARPNGQKSWGYRYQPNGRDAQVTVGTFP